MVGILVLQLESGQSRPNCLSRLIPSHICLSILQNWYGGQYFRSFTSHELFPAQAAGVGASARVQAAETCQSQGRDRNFESLVLSPPPSLSAPPCICASLVITGCRCVDTQN